METPERLIFRLLLKTFPASCGIRWFIIVFTNAYPRMIFLARWAPFTAWPDDLIQPWLINQLLLSHTILSEQLIFMYLTNHLPVVWLAALTFTSHIISMSINFLCSWRYIQLLLYFKQALPPSSLNYDSFWVPVSVFRRVCEITKNDC
jgi:hypothetical protein